MSHTFKNLREAVNTVLVESTKVPQKFIDHARKVGSTPLFAELTYRNWSKRGLTDQQIIDKIDKHAGEQKKNESVEEAMVAIEEAVTKELDEAKYGENTPARKIAAAKSFIKQYEQSLKHAIADGKPAETVNFWKKRLEKEKKALTALMKSESVEDLGEGAVTSDVAKAVTLVRGLDAEETETFLREWALHLDNDSEEDPHNVDFKNLYELISKAHKAWKNRKGN